MKFSVHEAKTHLSKLIDLVKDGEDVVILCRGKPVAQLVASRARKKPVLGGMKDAPAWPFGWQRPLTDEEADAFYEGRY